MTDAPAPTAAITGMADELGRVDWLHFNPSAFRQKTPVDLTAEELLTDVRPGRRGAADRAARRPPVHVGPAPG